MNTVFFSIYDSGCCSSALLLNDNIDWGMIDQTMYKRNIPDVDEVSDYDDEKLFAFFSRMFNAEIRRIIIAIDGEVCKVRCNFPKGFFGYGVANGKVQEIDVYIICCGNVDISYTEELKMVGKVGIVGKEG